MKKIRKEIGGAILLTACVIALVGLIDFIRFPDCYIPELKNSLKSELRAGDKATVEYYEARYVAKGRALFEEGEI